MNPPQEQIDLMLKYGYIGCVVSVFCLTAAYSVKHGLQIKDFVAQDPFTHEPLDAKQQALAMDVMTHAYEKLRRGTPDQVDHAIALYTAHLKAAGYNVTVGSDN